MSIDKDLSDFSYYSSMLSIMKDYEDELPIQNTLKNIRERSSLFIEMMGAAFIQEVGLKASEVELVCYIGMDKITWSFRKKEA